MRDKNSTTTSKLPISVQRIFGDVLVENSNIDSISLTNLATSQAKLLANVSVVAKARADSKDPIVRPADHQWGSLGL